MGLLSLYEKIVEAAALGGMQQIVEAAHAVLGMPIVIADVSFKVLAAAPQGPIGDRVWDTMSSRGYAPQDLVMEFHELLYMESIQTKPLPYTVDWGACAELPRIQEVIRIDGAVEAYVALLCPREAREPWHDQAATAIARACTAELARTAHPHVGDDLLLHVLVEELFGRRIGNRAQLEAWERRMNRPLPGGYAVLAIRTPEREGAATLKYIRHQLLPRFPRQLSLIEHDLLLVLLHGLGERDDAASLSRSIGFILRPFGAECGMSRGFGDLLELHAYRQQAERALELGGAADRRESGVCLYDDVALQAVLSAVPDDLPCCNWIAPAVLRVAEHDRAGGTDYLATLRAYVMQVCSTQRTVEQLHIHRNTLLYRLNKIEEIIGHPVDDPGYFPHLLLSFQLLTMQQNADGNLPAALKEQKGVGFRESLSTSLGENIHN